MEKTEQFPIRHWAGMQLTRLVVAKVTLKILFKISIVLFIFPGYASVNSRICSAKPLAITLLCSMLKKKLEIASTTDSFPLGHWLHVGL